MGHRSIATTERCSHLAPTTLDDEVKTLGVSMATASSTATPQEPDELPDSVRRFPKPKP
jgi:hypothetical protein